jgi:molybdate transport system permease protein
MLTNDRAAGARRVARPAPGQLLQALAAVVVILFLGLPVLALVLRAIPVGVAGWLSPTTLDALSLSLGTSTLAAALTWLFGTPLAYLLARNEFRGKPLIETLVDLPMVLPPAVAGLALLMAFGRRGLAGPPLAAAGLELPFTTAAVVMAEMFVAAPFYLRAARVGFAGTDRRLEQMSNLLGASSTRTFFRVTLPLAGPGLLSGLLMTWARALGEFGATIMFAGNLQGQTQTMPLAIYVGLESNLDSALALSLILVVVSFAILVLVRLARGSF